MLRRLERQFDTSVVAAFEAILATADEDYRLGLSADFNSGVTARDHQAEPQAAVGVA